ncbi:glycosyltransferase family 2 protein [Gluconobacter cerinus]|uniref:glycosyltransferase family 2 protein n=1 Tax=Gluconobacter cerinus TaxID=38307 RepID=UPI001B8BA379|nr:glycosyltransferase family 2 protein [Gluconobacter cerinus]MBS1032843.1 glycosyltransferase family 2 protein [Gluconobacter cerinus]
MKSSVALFIKDEVSDIIGWVSWYVNLGFDKIFIYDDHSKDGTFEILNILSKKYPIELFRTDLKGSINFFYRQKDSYLDALHRSKGIYDWVFLADGDEYLFLSEDENVNEFLSFYSEADAIAINWCIFGSSGKALKERDPIPFTYLHRALEDFGVNRLVKSFVRPGALVDTYTDPHRYPVSPEKYFDTHGREIRDWVGATKPVTWHKARVNHYICRSMEHYIGRVRRRLNVDIENSDQGWNDYNKNDIFDDSSKKYLLNTLKIFDDMRYIVFSEMKEKLNFSFRDEIEKENNIKNIKVFSIINHNNKIVFSDTSTGYLKGIEEGERVLFCVDIETGIGQFFTYSNSICRIQKDDRLNVFAFYEMVNFEDGISLKNIKSGLFLISIPSEIDPMAFLEASRTNASSLEKFHIKEVSENTEFIKFSFLENIIFSKKISNKLNEYNSIGIELFNNFI